MNKLYLVRHAKSSWKYPELSDLQRPLNGRGKKSVADMSRRLFKRGVWIDRLFCSPARRAHKTALRLAEGIAFDTTEIEITESLYFEGIESMMSLLQSTGSANHNLMLVGHNPDMTHFLNSLVGHTTDNMPTCAIAEIGFNESWQEVDFGKGILIDYDYPKKESGELGY